MLLMQTWLPGLYAMYKSGMFAVITARSGSKGIRNKNLRELCGKPLLAYSIEASLGCPEIDSTILSTDSIEMANVGRDYGIDVLVRPEELAQDDSRSEDVVRHVLLELESRSIVPDSIMLLQPTSPLRTARHISDAISRYRSSKALSCMGITEAEHHPYKDFVDTGECIKPLFGVEYLSAPRQSLPKVYRQNGAIYIVNASEFLLQNTFYLEPVVFYKMSREESVDIDSDIDLEIAAYYLARNDSQHSNRIR